MKKSLMFFLLVSFCIIPFAFAEQILPSKIKEVTLFSGQALVKRQAIATVQTGLNELLIETESFRVDRDSVTAKVFGAGEIFSVQFKEIPLKESPQEKIKVLKQKIKELEKSKNALSDKKMVLTKKASFLESIIDFSKTQIPEEIKTRFPKVEELDQILSFISSSYQKINNEKHALDASIKETQKKINVLKEELRALQRPHKNARKVIEILFNSKRVQTIRIEADYLTKNAHWQPLYKVSVPLTLSEIDLTMFSKILQKTGEDWKQVALSISNVIPLSGARLPTLSSWILDFPRPLAKKREMDRLAYKASAPDAEALEDTVGVAVAEEKATYVAAVRKKLPLSFEYKMPQPISIESRDKETVLPLFTKTLQGDFYYYAVPQQNALTFLVCEAQADKELLSGFLNVYFGGRYVGKTFLREKKSGEEFYLNLGADREVKVKREKVRDKIKETFFGKIERDTVTRELAYKITLENIKDRSAKLKVLDSIPVSRTDKVVVKDLKLTPEPAEKNYLDREGVMVWEQSLASGEKQAIQIEFVITYPKDFIPPGL